MKSLLISAAYIIATASFAFASSGGGGEEQGSAFMGHVYQVLNFVILVTVLVVVGRKPIKEALKNRTESIRKRVEDASAAKSLAEEALSEVKARLASKDKEKDEMMAASTRSGENERARLIEDGKRMSQMLKDQAKSNIDYELRQGRDELKAEAARLALELAEQKIKDKLDPGMQRKLLEESMSRLEAGN